MDDRGGSADRSARCHALPTGRSNGREGHSDGRADRCNSGGVVPADFHLDDFPGVDGSRYVVVALPRQVRAPEYVAVAEADALPAGGPLQDEIVHYRLAERRRPVEKPSWLRKTP